MQVIAESFDHKHDLLKLIEISKPGPTKVHRNKDILILMKVLIEKFELLGKELCSLQELCWTLVVTKIQLISEFG